MRTTRKTGAYWFAQQLVGPGEEVAPTDGEYFFPNGGLVSFKDALPRLRLQYAHKLKRERKSKREKELTSVTRELCGDKQVHPFRAQFLHKRRTELIKLLK